MLKLRGCLVVHVSLKISKKNFHCVRILSNGYEISRELKEKKMGLLLPPICCPQEEKEKVKDPSQIMIKTFPFTIRLFFLLILLPNIIEKKMEFIGKMFLLEYLSPSLERKMFYQTRSKCMYRVHSRNQGE
jgi:hypothetical protein